MLVPVQETPRFFEGVLHYATGDLLYERMFLPLGVRSQLGRTSPDYRLPVVVLLDWALGADR